MEETKQIDITFSDLFGIFRRCWILMLAVAVVVAILATLIVATLHQDVYTSEVGLWAYRTGSEDDSTGNVQQNYYANIMSTQQIDEFMEIAQSRTVLEKVIADQNLTISPKDLAKMLKVTQRGNASSSTIFYLEVTAATPESANRLCEAWSRVACEYINGLLKKGVLLEFETASLPQQPSNPFSILKVILVAVVGAAIVYIVYFVRFLMDDKVNTAEDVERYLDLHVLGAIPDKTQLTRKRSKGGYYYASSQSDAPKLN